MVLDHARLRGDAQHAWPFTNFRMSQLPSEASAPGTNFTCYGLAENTDFQSFLAEAESSNLECNSGAYNETGYPLYTCSASVRKQENRHTVTLFVMSWHRPHRSEPLARELTSLSLASFSVLSSYKVFPTSWSRQHYCCRPPS